MRSAALPAAVVFALAVPFHAFWLDPEAARRAVAMLAAALLALTARAWLPARLDRVGMLLLGLAAWHLVRCIGVANPALGIERGLWWLALWIVFAWGRTAEPRDWLRAALPAGIVVSAFGLLQALGVTRGLHVWLHELDPNPASWSPLWMWLQGCISYEFHDVGPADAISTLANRNFASEFAALAGAAAGVLVMREERWRLAATTTTLCMSYLLVNGSRSGLLAFPIAIAVLLLQRGTGQRRRLLLVAAVLAGLALGLLAHLARPGPETPSDNAQLPTAATAPAPGPSSIEVRLLIWQGGLAMASGQPVLGHGSGQFQIDYPRYRDPREIDLSSTGVDGPRSFRALPRTAHNDYLEILIETGAPGLLLWAAFLVLIGVCAARQGIAAAAPLVVLLVLSLVRSPLGNAPAAVLALGYAGSLRGQPDGRAPWWWCVALLVPAAAWAWLGVHTLAGQTVAAGYLQNGRFEQADFPADKTLTAAIGWTPEDSRLRGLRLAERLGDAQRTGRPPSAAELDDDLDATARLEPYESGLLLLRARAAQLLGQPGRALNLVLQVRALDPQDPEAAIYEATLRMERGEAAEAIAALYRDTHPNLRARLAQHFAALATEAERMGRPADEVLVYRVEAAFMTAVGETRRATGSREAMSAVDALTSLLKSAGVTDLRPIVLGAINLPDQAADLGELARRSGLTLTAPHRRMLDGLEQPLLAIPPWREVLGPGA